MRSDKLKKLAQALRKTAEGLNESKREKTAKIAVAAVGLQILREKILSEIP